MAKDQRGVVPPVPDDVSDQVKREWSSWIRRLFPEYNSRARKRDLKEACLAYYRRRPGAWERLVREAGGPVNWLAVLQSWTARESEFTRRDARLAGAEAPQMQGPRGQELERLGELFEHRPELEPGRPMLRAIPGGRKDGQGTG